VASFWQALPNKTNAEIMQLVKQSAHLFLNPTAQMGYGIPDFSLALTLNTASFSKYKILLYPNPATSTVNLQLPNDFEKASVLLYNNLGQQVLNAEISANSQSFSVSKLTSGIYFYKIMAGNISQTGKLIKN
jgi:serine protease AprX